MLSLLSNLASLRSLRLLSGAVKQVETSYTRLSSGLRINRASDDAAGLSIASKLNLDSRVYGTAIRNGNDVVSALNIASGTVGELSNVLVRMRELATQSANGTLSRSQRLSLHSEADALTKEYNRLVSTTRFNGLSLFSPTTEVSAKLGYGATLPVNIGDGIQRATGTGNFSNPTSTSGGSDYTGVVTFDANNDGHLDVISASRSGEVIVELGDGNGGFSGEVNSFIGPVQDLYSIDAADLDGDGLLDIVVGTSAGASSRLYTLKNNGNGTFTQQGTFFGSGSGIRAVELADFNGDGKTDVLAGDNLGVLSLYQGGGGFSFSNTAAWSQNIGSAIYDLDSGDFNGDGKLDFAAASLGFGGSVGYGSGQLSFSGITSLDGDGSTVSVGDVNRDGLDDILLVKGASNLRIYTSTGNSFSLVTTENVAADDADLVDLNGDGYLDILASGASFINDGTGVFSVTPTYTWAVGANSESAIGDFDEDGALDFFIAESGNPTMLFGEAQTINTMEFVNLSSRSGALAAINTIDNALERIGKETGIIGSSLSRLESALSNLHQSRENFTAAASRITDADVAEESSSLVRSQILQQAGGAILGQANIQPELALLLLAPPR